MDTIIVCDFYTTNRLCYKRTAAESDQIGNSRQSVSYIIKLASKHLFVVRLISPQSSVRLLLQACFQALQADLL